MTANAATSLPPIISGWTWASWRARRTPSAPSRTTSPCPVTPRTAAPGSSTSHADGHVRVLCRLPPPPRAPCARLHAGNREEFEDLDRSAHGGVRVPVEHLSESFGVVRLQDGETTDGVAGVATGLDDVERGAEIDHRVTGPLGPRHPGVHTRLGLLGRARSHLLGCRRRGTVEHEELRHRRRSSPRISSLFDSCLFRQSP